MNRKFVLNAKEKLKKSRRLEAEMRRLKRVRSSHPYQYWLGWYRMLYQLKVPIENISTIMKLVHLAIDEKRGYHYKWIMLK